MRRSEVDRSGTKNDLLLFVRNYYYSVVLEEAAIQIQKEHIQYLTTALELEQRQFEIGNSTSLEVNQSKVALANAISDFYMTVKKAKNARNALIEVEFD